MKYILENLVGNKNWRPVSSFGCDFSIIYMELLANRQHNSCGFEYRIVDEDNKVIVKTNNEGAFIEPFEHNGFTRESFPRFV